jgi:predicted metal-dependent peptidase
MSSAVIVKSKLPAEKRIELVHVSLMRNPKFAFFVGLFMVGSTKVQDDPHMTAWTNGRDAGYGRQFVDTLTDKELAFLVMHENMHKCYRHLTTWKALNDINHRIAGAACDYVINIQLVDMDPDEEFLAFPRSKVTGALDGLLDPAYRGMDTKQVFDILMKKCKGGEGGEEGNGNPVDGSGKGKGEGEGDGTNQPSVGKFGDKEGFDAHDWDGAQEMPEEEKKKLNQEIEQAIRQGGIFAGKFGGNTPREIGELLNPKVDWREVLKRFTRNNIKDRDSISWRKAHKNFLWQDIILPSILGKRVKYLLLGMDTSGSVEGQLLTDFLSEMNGLVKSVGIDRLDVVYWDAEVQAHEIFTGSTKDIVHRTNPKGGGGTNPDVVVDLIVEKQLKPDAIIMLSDGYMHTNKAKWSAITQPTLWCIIGNDEYEVPNGQKLVIKE